MYLCMKLSFDSMLGEMNRQECTSAIPSVLECVFQAIEVHLLSISFIFTLLFGLGDNNPHHLFVASQDRELRNALRKIAGIAK